MTHAMMTHAGNMTQMFSHLLALQWWLVDHQKWVAHRFGYGRHPRWWAAISELEDSLNWLVGHWPSSCKGNQICKLG